MTARPGRARGVAGCGRPTFAAARRTDHVRWREADRAARPARLGRASGAPGDRGRSTRYFGVRRGAHALPRPASRSATARRRSPATPASSSCPATRSSCWPTAATRSRRDARRPTHGSSSRPIDLPARWPALVASVGARRVAVEAGFVSHAPLGAAGRRRAGRGARAGRGLGGGGPGDEGTRRRSSGSRAACAVADRALAALLPEIRAGRDRARARLRLEWLMRTGGAEALAFDVACLAGPEAALPHGSPGERPVRDGPGAALRLRGAGRRLPKRHDADAVRRRAGGARSRGLRARGTRPGGADRRAASGGRRRRPAAGRSRAATPPRGRSSKRPGMASSSATAPGHGIGLATHELPSLCTTAPRRRRSRRPTVFWVEPGRLPRGRDGRPDRGPGAGRCGAPAVRAADAFPARGHRRRG